VQFLDERTFEGNVLSQLDEAMAFITRNTRQAIVITGRPEREIVPEYPSEAVREAIINAICHRDYAATGTVQVRVYDDRLEVWNPGTLPPGITIEDLYKEHSSHPRNPRLAAALHRARLIEHWGTGTLRIVQACEDRRMPRPEFITQGRSFIVRFTRAPAEVQIPAEARVSDRQRKALEYVREHGRITTSIYSSITGVSIAQSKRDLGFLVANGLLQPQGKGRAACYVRQSPNRLMNPEPIVARLCADSGPFYTYPTAYQTGSGD